MKRGRSGDEIVRSMLELPNIPKKSRGNRRVVYAGKEYPSAAEACRQLGIKKDRVYNLLRHGPSTEEAISKALELQRKARGKTDGRSSSGSTDDSCIIDGVAFPNRRAACHAFDVSYPSVMSRIRRHPEMSFEDALLYGARKWRYIKPVRQMSAPAGELKPCRHSNLNGEEPTLPLLLVLEELLVANDYGDAGDFDIEWDTDPERWVLEMTIYLHPPKGRRELDICYEETSPAFVRSFQFFLQLLVIPQPNDPYTDPQEPVRRCQTVINQLHSEFAGVTLNILDRTVRANGLYIAPGQSFSGRQFLYAMHRFIGTAAEMHRRLAEALGCVE